MNSSTLATGAVLLLTLLMAAFIAYHGDNPPQTAAKETPITVSGSVPERHRATEASVVPQPEPLRPIDPLPPRPNNWR